MSKKTFRQGRRKGHSPVAFLVIALIVAYALISGASAVLTVSDCGGWSNPQKEWTFFPPAWEC